MWGASHTIIGAKMGIGWHPLSATKKRKQLFLLSCVNREFKPSCKILCPHYRQIAVNPNLLLLPPPSQSSLTKEKDLHGEAISNFLSYGSWVPTSKYIMVPQLQILILFKLHLKPYHVSSGLYCPSNVRVLVISAVDYRVIATCEKVHLFGKLLMFSGID